MGSLFDNMLKNNTLSRGTGDKKQLNTLIRKSKSVKKSKPVTRKGTSLTDKIKNTCDLVQNKLGKYQELVELLSTKEDLHEYINSAIEFGEIAIDTETTGLDPITDQIVGACIYVPGRKGAYIPINHISSMTRERVANQLTNEEVSEEFKRLVDNNVKVIYFNAKFDIRVMRWQLKLDIPPYWDCFIAAKCLKENEDEASLKYLWKKYCSPDKDAPHFTFDKLFHGITFNLIPINTAYLYAGMDAKMTYELYDFQRPWLDENDVEHCQRADLTRVSKLFKEIEMPIVSIVADIEDRGVEIDVDYCKSLSEKYNKILKQNIEDFNTALEPYKEQIQAWVNTHPQTKIENPINIGSTDQLAELFYDILKCPSVSKKKPRGTGEEILSKLNHPLCKPILAYRGTTKLLSTYIDKMPEIVNKKTKRIHCNFKQYGADTGRFACISKDTPVHTTIGPMFIQTLEPGMEVYCYDSYGTLTTDTVLNVVHMGRKNCIRLIFESEIGKTILVCTPDHRIFHKSYEWMRADNLVVGDEVFSLNGMLDDLPEDISTMEPRFIRLIETSMLSISHEVYDIQTENHHNFIAAGVCVHNCDSPNLQNIPSHNSDIRPLFVATTESTVEMNENSIKLLVEDEVQTTLGYVKSQDLINGNILLDSKNQYHTITNINREGKNIIVSFE